jgi:uncharacterized membrane protein
MIRRWLVNIAAVAIIALTTHVALFGGTPYLIMSRVMKGAAARAGGTNTAFAGGELPTAADRAVVRPSPDLLYGFCAFDIGEGPVLVGGTPSQAYWSMALYASNTDNFFVLNDRQAGGKPVQVVLSSREALSRIPAEYKSLRVIEPPSRKGLALFRYLVLDDGDLASAREVQKAQVCRKL